MTASLVLLTGATGYIGGRLLPRLVAAGYRVRCLARTPENLRARAGYRVRCLARTPENLRARLPEGADVAGGDLLDAATLPPAFAGADIAIYLVHSMNSPGDFAEEDRRAAENFGRAAKEAGVRRIVYLGGLGEEEEELSPHLKSRHEVGNVLRASGVPVLELRASIILGSGSLSFEMIRALTERLPVMITPRWVEVAAQPIHVDDVLACMIAVLALDAPESRTFEIGGLDVVSYGDLMREYARQRGLKRMMLRVPFLTPYLSSLWLGLVTPLYARIGRKLIQSIVHPTVVKRNAAADLGVAPAGAAEAMARALRNEEREFAETRWSDALSSTGEGPFWGGRRFGNRLVDSRVRVSTASIERTFAAVERIGGRNGWYYGNLLWRIRGWLDLLAGGVGMRRGRRDPFRLSVGDTLDCWRVETVIRPERLKLRAEMMLPGRAWLEFEVDPHEDGSRIRQTATFDPLGLSGLLYWYGVWPLHQLVFEGMLRNLTRASETPNGGARDAAALLQSPDPFDGGRPTGMTHLSMNELEAGLDDILASPKDVGTLALIVRRPVEGEREVLEEGRLDLLEGLVGDNWKSRGSNRTPDGSAHPDMQINVMNVRAARLVAGSPERRALAGDQLFVDLDLSRENLPEGTRLRIGEAVIEITAPPHTGCRKFTERFGMDAVKFVNSEVGRAHRLRGLNAKVVEPGAIRAGDRVHVTRPGDTG